MWGFVLGSTFSQEEGIGDRYKIYEPINHPLIDPQNFSLYLASQPQKACFDIYHLADILCKVANSNPFANLRPHQINTLHSPIPDTDGHERQMLALLKEWFHIFNSAFFGGGLLELVDHVELYHGGEEGKLVFGRYSRMLSGPGKLGINLDETIGLEGNSIEETRIGTLLHEMIHAFLWIYQCRRKHCACLKMPFANREERKETSYSHGPHWASAMHEIAKALQDQVAWDVFYGLEDSVVDEMENSGWVPTNEQLSRWGMIPGVPGEILQRKIAKLKERAAVLKKQREEEKKRQQGETQRTQENENWWASQPNTKAPEREDGGRKQAAKERHGQKMQQRHLQEMDLKKEQLLLPGDRPPNPSVKLAQLNLTDPDTRYLAAEVRFAEMREADAKGYQRLPRAEEDEVIRSLAAPTKLDPEVEQRASDIGSQGVMNSEIKRAGSNGTKRAAPSDDGDTFNERILHHTITNGDQIESEGKPRKRNKIRRWFAKLG